MAVDDAEFYDRQAEQMLFTGDAVTARRGRTPSDQMSAGSGE
ncbi:MAG TPA: hypothetical protein VFS16_14895 [Acidimicrobiia bacterium]|nr:hypothetical protein [Acidimicrobiia bacterium]